MIVADGLTKIFLDPKRGGEFRAVDEVSFTCRPGEGPHLHGVISVSPSLEYLERAYDDAKYGEPALAREKLGFCTGATGIYERLSPREMIRYFGRLYGLDGEALDARTDELLDLFELRPYADTACGRLSAGNRQKVSLARTIVHEPPVLIFDEPTTSLDILVARTVTEFVSRCREEGRTVILSTHIMSEVEKLCDDVAMLHCGRILLQGSKEEVLADAGVDSIEELFFNRIDACDAEASA